jgi:hypothetical protein
MALTERAFTIPEVMLVTGTRVALGIGIGLLISDRLTKEQRKGAGLALLAVGVLSTSPIARACWPSHLLPLPGKPTIGAS